MTPPTEIGTSPYLGRDAHLRLQWPSWLLDVVLGCSNSELGGILAYFEHTRTAGNLAEASPTASPEYSWKLEESIHNYTPNCEELSLHPSFVFCALKIA